MEAAWRPPLGEFAPYTAHCLLVDVFSHVCIDKTLISPGRPTNRIDIAYIYYLPFVMMFASNDKLHARIAPLFLGEEQAFVWGGDLKTDLSRLDAHFSAADVEKEGLFRVAGYPPDDETFLTTKLWRRFGMPTRPAPEARDPDALPKPTVEDRRPRRHIATPPELSRTGARVRQSRDGFASCRLAKLAREHPRLTAMSPSGP